MTEHFTLAIIESVCLQLSFVLKGTMYYYKEFKARVYTKTFHVLLQTQRSVLRLLSKFLREHGSNLSEAFTLQDKGKCGTLSTEETKYAFREAGLRLTNVRTL